MNIELLIAVVMLIIVLGLVCWMVGVYQQPGDAT